MISISKIMVPLQFSGFLLYVVKLARVLVTYVKHLSLCIVGGVKLCTFVQRLRRHFGNLDVATFINQ